MHYTKPAKFKRKRIDYQELREVTFLKNQLQELENKNKSLQISQSGMSNELEMTRTNRTFTDKLEEKN